MKAEPIIIYGYSFSFGKGTVVLRRQSDGTWKITMNQQQQGQKKILVVDDEADLTMLSKLALEYHGFNVDTFNDPLEALSNYKPGYYDLVILDIKMPKMDGFQLYDEIKKKDQKAKVCLLTASELYYQEFRKREYDAIDKNLFIKKPIDNEDLLKEVNRIISSPRLPYSAGIDKTIVTLSLSIPIFIPYICSNV
jgi:DNA-binding response OmpR family regulator